MLNLYGKIHSFRNVVGRFNGSQERRSKDMLNPFLAKPNSCFFCLDDAVICEIRVSPLPLWIDKIYPITVSAYPDGPASHYS